MLRGRLLLLSLAVALLGGTSCDPGYMKVAVLGDSHSDPDRDPRFDWTPWHPTHWRLDDHATAGQKCWEIVPLTLANPHALHPNDYLLLFCGTNDAGRADWDLAVTVAWLETAIQAGVDHHMAVTLVTPPPVFRDYPVHRDVRNQRLAELREAIFGLADQYEVEVADLWDEVQSHEDPASLFQDGLHFTGLGRYITAQVIHLAVHRSRYQLGHGL